MVGYCMDKFGGNNVEHQLSEWVEKQSRLALGQTGVDQNTS